MHMEAPNLTDLAMSPLVLIPPSAIIGLLAALAQRRTAASCQPPVPNPVLILVIHALPGPIPTLVASAPAFSSSRTPSGVPTLPAIKKTPESFCLIYLIMSITV